MSLLIVALNVAYAIAACILSVAAMSVGYRALDRLTPFETSWELSQGNRAVGMMVAGMFVGIGLATGLAVGLALN